MKNKNNIRRMVGIASLCAIAFVLQFWIAGIIPKLPIGGGTAINLALIPVVVGAILYGPTGGLSVGLFLGAVTLLPGQGAGIFFVEWYTGILAVLLCLLKTGLAGFVAGVLYKIISKKNYIVAIFASAIIAPTINSGTFLLLDGLIVQLMDGTPYAVTFVGIGALVGYAYMIELIINIVLSPTIGHLVRIIGKNYDLGFANSFENIEKEDNEVVENDTPTAENDKNEVVENDTPTAETENEEMDSQEV